MKRCLYLMAVVALLLAVGCSPEKAKNEQSPEVVADTTDTVAKMPTDTVIKDQPEVLTAEGTAVGGAMNSIIIEDAGGETLDFEYPQLSRDSIDAWEEGNKMQIRYTKDAAGNVVQSVRVVQ